MSQHQGPATADRRVSGRPARAWDRWLDFATFLVVCWLISFVWPRSLPVPGLDVDAPPWWGGPRDQLLDGPDAGEWAKNASLLAQWKLDALDHHRLPAWLFLLAGLSHFTDGIALAGHLGNRLLFASMGLAIFAIGRAGGGRAVGLLAAGLVLTAEHLAVSAQRFGVDAVVSAALSLSLLSSVRACRSLPFAFFAGLAAGATTGLHYTTIPYVLPPLVLLILRAGPTWGRKFLSILLFVGGFAAMVAALLQVWPVPQASRFAEDIANGISPGHRGGGAVGSVEDSLAILQQNLAAAPAQAVANGLKGLPIPLLAQVWPAGSKLLVWLGVLGLGTWQVFRPLPAGRGLRQRRPLFDLGLGFVILSCLAPLPLLTAVGAPARYGDNLLPFVALLLARGIVALADLFEGLLRTVLPSLHLGTFSSRRLPHGLPALALAAVLLGSVIPARAWLRRPPPLTDDEVGTLLLARALEKQFPPGTEVACPVRESVFMAGLGYCPERICPVNANEDLYRQCLRVLHEECSGEGPIGYVATSARHLYDPNARARPQMDAWVNAQFGVAETVRWKKFEATVHRIPREAVPTDAEVPAWGSGMGMP
jgi:hypothetical protein